MAIKILNKKETVTEADDIKGATPWQNENNRGYPEGLTISRVDEQDHLSLEDYLDDTGNVDLDSGVLLSTVSQLATQNAVYNAVKSIKNLTSETKASYRPSGTVEETDDFLGKRLAKIKDGKYKKNVKLSSKLGLYNSYMNLLGNAAGLYIGTLGKNTLEQVADAALSQTNVGDLTLGLGVASIKRIVKALTDSRRKKGVFSSVDIPLQDVLSLNLANFFTITSAKPGLTIRGTNTELMEFVSDPSEGVGKDLLNSLKSFGGDIGGDVFDKILKGQSSSAAVEKATAGGGIKPLISSKNKTEYATKMFGFINTSFQKNSSIIDANGVIHMNPYIDDEGDGESVNKKKQALSDAENELSDAENELSEAEKKLSDVDNELTEAESELTEADNKVLEADSTIEQLTAMFSDKNSDFYGTPLAQQEEALKGAQKEKDKAQKAKDKAEKKVNKAEKKRNKAEEKKKKAEEKKNEKQSKRDSAQSSLEKEQEEQENKKNQYYDEVFSDDTIFTSSFRPNGGINIEYLEDYRKNFYGYINEDETVGDLKFKRNVPGVEDGVGDFSYEEIEGKYMINGMRKLAFINGGLYVEPFLSSTKKSSYIIPFEFNADIQEQSLKAEYTPEKILGRNLSIKSYINTDSDGISITTQYMVLSKYEDDYYYSNKNESWMYFWTEYKIQEVERNLRALVFPTIENSNFTRPPIVRVIMPRPNGDFTKGIFTDEIFSYPSASADKHFEITKVFDSDTTNTTLKRYVVSSVQISPMDNWNASYSYTKDYQTYKTYTKRSGFKVTMNLFETTKNFLDSIPSFNDYNVSMSHIGTDVLQMGYKPETIKGDN